MNIDQVSHAIAMRLLAAIADDADEATLKAAVVSFPEIIARSLEEALKDKAGGD